MKKTILIFLVIAMGFSLNSCDFFTTEKQEKETKPKTEKKQKKVDPPKKAAQEKPAVEKKKAEEKQVQKADQKYFLIMESFKVPDNALAFNKKLKDQGYQSQIIERENGFHCVTYKGFNDKQKAIEELKADRQKPETSDAWLIVKKGV